MSVDLRVKKNCKVVTEVGSKCREVPEKRYVEYDKTRKELKIEYRVEYGRQVSILESNGNDFRNPSSGHELKVDKIENGVRVGVLGGDKVLSDVLYNIKTKILRETTKKDLKEVVIDNKEYKTTIVEGISYRLKEESIEYKGISKTITIIELKLEEVQIEGEDTQSKRKLMKKKMTGVDISLSGKMSVESLVKIGYDKKTETLTIYEACKGCETGRNTSAEVIGEIKKIERIKYPHSYNSKDLSSLLKITDEVMSDTRDYNKDREVQVEFEGKLVCNKSRIREIVRGLRTKDITLVAEEVDFGNIDFNKLELDVVNKYVSFSRLGRTGNVGVEMYVLHKAKGKEGKKGTIYIREVSEEDRPSLKESFRYSKSVYIKDKNKGKTYVILVD